VAAGTMVLKRRFDREKSTVGLADLSPQWLRARMEQIHQAMFEKAKAFRDQNTRSAATYEELKKILSEHGGFVRAWFKPDREAEAKIKAETKATVRCIPLEQTGQTGPCIFSGQTCDTQVLFALAY
jgi:prolyl-tRNA synthetase